MTSVVGLLPGAPVVDRREHDPIGAPERDLHLASGLERPVDVEDVGNVEPPGRAFVAEMDHRLAAALGHRARVLADLLARTGGEASCVGPQEKEHSRRHGRSLTDRDGSAYRVPESE